MPKKPEMTPEATQASESLGECFVIMPISDVDPYPSGHFGRVYAYVIAPACRRAGFEPILASRVASTNFIVLDILRRVISAEMVVCDLSARNPNVLYELGVRQAFNNPVTLVKDKRTTRVFDIQGLRDVEYDESLRADTVEEAVEEISKVLSTTYQSSRSEERDINSLVQLLGIQPAAIPTPKEVTADTQLLLNAIAEIGDRLSVLESTQRKPSSLQLKSKRVWPELTSADTNDILSAYDRAFVDTVLENISSGQHDIVLLKPGDHVVASDGFAGEILVIARRAAVVKNAGGIYREYQLSELKKTD